MIMSDGLRRKSLTARMESMSIGKKDITMISSRKLEVKLLCIFASCDC